MKKNRIFALALVMLLIVSTAVLACSCGSKGSSSSSDVKEKDVEAKKPTLEEYFTNNPKELKKIKEKVTKDENMEGILKIVDFDVYAKENTMTYSYKFKETYDDEKVAKMKEQLDKSLEDMGADMPEKIKSIEKGYGVGDVTIRMEYLNGDGSVIAEKEYTK